MPFNIGAAISKLAGIDPVAILDKGAQIADRFISSPDEKAAFQLELMKLKAAEQSEALQARMDAEKAAYSDKSDARAMFAKDNTLQKIFALTFLVGFMALTCVMLYFVFVWIGGQKIDLPAWAVSLVSAIYGIFAAKIGTIVDFLFGSSSGSRDKDDLIKSLQSVPTEDTMK